MSTQIDEMMIGGDATREQAEAMVAALRRMGADVEYGHDQLVAAMRGDEATYTDAQWDAAMAEIFGS